ncbi:MAG: hypothetical protein KFF50_15810 [Desulfatitalea sp.]|nr:hypothetical protein [Desulfatitalea sp.]
MVEEKGVTLDAEAQRLFAQFGGLEAYKAPSPVAGSAHLTQRLLEEQKRHDAVRMLMVQATWLISRYLVDARFATHPQQEDRLFGKVVEVLDQLSRAGGHLGYLLIRFRGTPTEPDLPGKCDYELVLGHTVVDSGIVLQMARRNGSAWSRLPDQLHDAFTALADYGVNNIFVRLPTSGATAFAPYQMCLKILSGFRHARQSGAPIDVQFGSEHRTVPLINDENLFPDPNLTLVAGLNRLSAGAMETLVDKVDRWLRHQATESAVKRYAGVYNAALELPKVRDKVQRPPVELNNVRWLISETEHQVVPADKLHIARLAMDLAGASPQQVAKMIQSVYGEDYGRINALLLGERLHLSSDLLRASGRQPQTQGLTKTVLGNLRMRLEQVKDTVIDDIHVVEASNATAADKPVDGAHGVHKDLYRMVTFLKGRSDAHKKMVGMVHQTIRFTDRDYTILAKDFRINRSAAETIVHILKGCFSDEGRFQKRAFAEAVPLFRTYEQKIFHFLWHHMKDVVLPGDRIAFLNALQALTKQMDQPKKALKILLEDLCANPATIQFSDNKAIMLANLILHREKSITDYDVTPEDIVLSRHTIDLMVAQYAAWRLAKDQEAFSTKMQTIHHKLIEALHLGQTSDQHLPAAVLLNLERELYIFLSLVACDVSKTILRSAAHEYGDPTAALYHQQGSHNCMGALLQNLRVALRGVGCSGSMADTPLLEGIKANEETFLRLKKDPHYRAQARLITEWVDEAIKLIKFRS